MENNTDKDNLYLQIGQDTDKYQFWCIIESNLKKSLKVISRYHYLIIIQK